MDDSKGTPVDVSVEEVGAAALPLLRRLMQLYLYDLGSIDGWDVDPEGLYGNPDTIERFWSERGRRSFLFKVGGAVAGFALVRHEAALAGPGTHEISEFFVLRKYRRRGVGEHAATRLFDMAPGPWEVNQMASNLPAQEFWRTVIRRYTAGAFTDGEYELDEGSWRRRVQVQRFTAPGAGSRP